MTLLLEPDLSSYSDEKYEADLRRLPPQRYEKTMTYRFLADRKRCVRAYMLLWEGLAREYGVEEAPVFDFGSHGKPVLRDHPALHFSLSHSGNAVLCAPQKPGASSLGIQRRGAGVDRAGRFSGGLLYPALDPEGELSQAYRRGTHRDEGPEGDSHGG